MGTRICAQLHSGAGKAEWGFSREGGGFLLYRGSWRERKLRVSSLAVLVASAKVDPKGAEYGRSPPPGDSQLCAQLMLGSMGPSRIARSCPASSHTLLLELGEEEDELPIGVHGPLSRMFGASCILEFRVSGVFKEDMAHMCVLCDTVSGIPGSAL